MRLSTVAQACEALRAGRPVLVLDDADRENEGDVVLAAETLTDAWMGWTVRHSSGYVCAPMPEEVADRLHLPPMVEQNQDLLQTAYTVTVDAVAGVTTGISATDRATTLRLLAAAGTSPTDLRRPGHVVPLRARAGGVLRRRGHTEAAVDLCRLAGLAPVAAIAELVDDAGEMLRGPAVLALGTEHDLPVITIADLVRHRLAHDSVTREATTVLPTEHGPLTVHAYRDVVTGVEHLALVGQGDVGAQPLVRLHSECLTGEALGSRRCDCGSQLDDALERVAHEGGVVIYLRGHEGRGVGLVDKLRAYAVQDTGADTVTAQHVLGLPVDARDYSAAAAILHDLGIADRPLRVITHNPAKVEALVRLGLTVAGTERSRRVPPPEAHHYLHTKTEQLGHVPHAIPASSATMRSTA